MFGIAYGVNQGFLPKDVFGPVVESGWAGLSALAQQPSGMVGWCQPVGDAPAVATASSTSDFCVGLFLLAGSEVYRGLSSQ